MLTRRVFIHEASLSDFFLYFLSFLWASSRLVVMMLGEGEGRRRDGWMDGWHA